MKFFRRFVIALAVVLLILNGLPFLLPVPNGTVDPQTLASPIGQFIRVDGVSIYVEQGGPDDGTPLILLHGLFGSTFTWRNQLTGLAEAGYRVIAYDRPPFGLSAKDFVLNYSPAAQADQLASLLDELRIERATFVGHSAGGSLLAHFAVRHAERIEQMVFAAGAFLGGGGGGPPAGVGAAFNWPPLTRWGEILIPAVLTRDRLAGIVAGFYADPDQMTPEVAAGYYRAFEVPGFGAGFMGLIRDTGSPVTEADVQKFTMPVLLLWGEADRVVPLRQAERLQALLPEAVLQVIPGTGHQPMEENPAEFNRMLIEWLEG